MQVGWPLCTCEDLAAAISSTHFPSFCRAGVTEKSCGAGRPLTAGAPHKMRGTTPRRHGCWAAPWGPQLLFPIHMCYTYITVLPHAVLYENIVYHILRYNIMLLHVVLRGILQYSLPGCYFTEYFPFSYSSVLCYILRYSVRFGSIFLVSGA